jgi:hypothetical protein
MMSRILLPLSLFSVASAFQIAETHEHVDYEGMKTALISMAERAKKSGIDGDTVSAISGFLDTINNTLIPALEKDRSSLQDILDTHVGEVNSCNTDKQTFYDGTYTSHVVTQSGASASHVSCRAEEAVAFCDYKSTCQILEDRVCQWTVCTIPDFTSGDSDAVNDYMECLDLFFDTHRPVTEYKKDRDDCINRTAVHSNKVAECDAAQESFEQAVCNREKDVSDHCRTYEECRCSTEKELALQEESARALENVFQMQFVALQHLKCYGDEILANTSIDLSKCDLNNVCTSYTGCPQLVYNDPDPFVLCDLPQETYPCQDQFHNDNYGAFGGAADDTAVPIAVACTAYTPVDDCRSCADRFPTSFPGWTWGGARQLVVDPADPASAVCTR